MKKVLLLVFLLASLATTAQIEKGTKMIGVGLGNMGYNFEGDAFSLSLYPSMAKFITPRLALGAQTNVSVFFSDGPIFYLGLQPYARLYNKSESPDRFFTQLSVGGSTLIDSGTTFFFTYGAGVGYNRFINKNLALELGLFHNGLVGDGSSNTLSVNLGVQLFLAKGEKLFRRKKGL